MSQIYDPARGDAGTQVQTQHALPSIEAFTSGVPAQAPHPQQPASNSGDSPNYVLNGSMRDSGNWSMQSAASKHSSVISTGTSGGSYETAINTPNRNSAVQNERSPFSAPYPNSHLSAGGPQQGLSAINRPYEGPDLQRHGSHVTEMDGRRDSVDSRMNQGMNSLAITSSPYQSNNASQSSLISGLQHQRGIQVDTRAGDRHSVSSLRSPISGDYASQQRRPQPTRVAPPIMPIRRTEWGTNAEEPTKGQPWAFPARMMAPGGPTTPASSPEDDSEHTYGSRRPSVATSMTSSLYTTDSRLPAGQRRLDDSGLPDVHHHQLQNKQLTDLMDDDDDEGHGGNMPYSRTPELRVSHKLAERKRRSEMKNLMEELRGRLPNTQGGKSSKWETLTRAIDYIKAIEAQNSGLRRELQRAQIEASDAHMLRQENSHLQHELQLLRQQAQQGGQAPVYHSQTQFTGHDGMPRTLPPLPSHPAPVSSMQGVQYGAQR